MTPLLADVSMAELHQLREEGMTNREIAEHLDVSVATIYRYLGKQPKKKGSTTMKNTHSMYVDKQDDLAKAIRTPEEVVAGMSDARWFVQTLKLMRIYTGIQGRYGHESVDRMADFGVYLSYDDINAVLDALGDHCLLCSKSKKEAQDCPLRKALERIPTQDTSEDSYCAVQRVYTEAVYST